MLGVITGDIVNSRNISNEIWLPILENSLKVIQQDDSKWEIYRGDSFQLEVNPEDAIEAAIIIKAAIKTIRNADVRMAIGVGEKKFEANNVTKSNGSAFVNSGEAFEKLGKRNLRIKTPWKEFNDDINVKLFVALYIMDAWSSKHAGLVKTKFENIDLNQHKLAEILDYNQQSSISRALQRAGYDEIKEVIEYYKRKINGIVDN